MYQYKNIITTHTAGKYQKIFNHFDVSDGPLVSFFVYCVICNVIYRSYSDFVSNNQMISFNAYNFDFHNKYAH